MSMKKTHSPLGPSSAERYLNCSASVKLCSELPDEQSEAGAKGSALHKDAEEALEAYILTGDTFNDNDDINGYVDAIIAISEGSAYAQILVEQLCAHPLNSGVFKGTADAVVIAESPEGTVLHLIDLKTGFVQVDPTDNIQMMLYALYYIRAEKLDVSRVVLHIYQPNPWGGNPLKSWELDDFAEKLGALEQKVILTALAIADDAYTFSVSSDNCKHCKAISFCPAVRERTAKVLTLKNDVAAELTTDDLDDAYLTLDVLTKYVERIETLITRKLFDGVEFSNVKLVAGRQGNAAWRDELEAEIKLLSVLDKSDVLESSLRSPAKIAEMLRKKKLDFKLDDLIVRRESRPVMAKSYDKRPAIKIVDISDEFSVL
jgi:CRISPR/Cas system-associated exonuclease Cas4 (RecB family)